MKKNIGFALMLWAFSSALHAYVGHAVVSVAAGAAFNDFDNAKLAVTTTETDTLHNKNNNNAAFISAIGLGYQVCNIYAGLGLYNTNLEDKGSVYLFGSPSLSDFKYHLPIHTTRLMLEGKLYGPAWYKLSPYFAAGIGASWNRNKYSETSVFDGEPGIILAKREQLKFAYQAGVGIQTPITQSLSAFAEYMYANLGHAKTSVYGNTPIIAPVSIPLHINSLLIGLGYSF